VFSTGLGFSFAIPHSKSEHIEQSTISVARLAQPVMWGDEEAQFVIMLTLNKHSAGDQHMRIFSRLARRIMHAEFRQSLVSAQSSEISRNCCARAGAVIGYPASVADRARVKGRWRAAPVRSLRYARHNAKINRERHLPGNNAEQPFFRGRNRGKPIIRL
jgi:hypothetical protein